MRRMGIVLAAAIGVWLATAYPVVAGEVRPFVSPALAASQAAAANSGQTEFVPAGSSDSFTDTSGRILKLADFRGKVVLLNFWASYCASCKREMPSLDRLQATLGGADFVVIPISVEGSEASIGSTYSDWGVSNLGIYRELSDDFPLRMGVWGLPTNILIDRDGRVVHFSAGPTQWDSSSALQLVKSLVGAIPAPLQATGQASLVTAAETPPVTGQGPSSH